MAIILFINTRKINIKSKKHSVAQLRFISEHQNKLLTFCVMSCLHLLHVRKLFYIVCTKLCAQDYYLFNNALQVSKPRKNRNISIFAQSNITTQIFQGFCIVIFISIVAWLCRKPSYPAALIMEDVSDS